MICRTQRPKTLIYWKNRLQRFDFSDSALQRKFVYDFQSRTWSISYSPKLSEWDLLYDFQYTDKSSLSPPLPLYAFSAQNEIYIIYDFQYRGLFLFLLFSPLVFLARNEVYHCNHCVPRILPCNWIWDKLLIFFIILFLFYYVTVASISVYNLLWHFHIVRTRLIALFLKVTNLALWLYLRSYNALWSIFSLIVNDLDE